MKAWYRPRSLEAPVNYTKSSSSVAYQHYIVAVIFKFVRQKKGTPRVKYFASHINQGTVTAIFILLYMEWEWKTLLYVQFSFHFPFAPRIIIIIFFGYILLPQDCKLSLFSLIEKALFGLKVREISCLIILLYAIKYVSI